MINPHHIKFAGISSEELNMLDLIMCAAMDSDNGESESFLNRSAVQSETHDGRYKPTVRYKFDEVFAPKFTFLKKDFKDFTQEDVRILLKYLTSRDTPALLEVFDDDSNSVSFAVIGGWTEVNLYKLANNRVIGITATFSATTPFAFSDLYTVTSTISSPTNNKITINIDTDDNKPVYPKVTIKHNGSVVRIPDGKVLTTTSIMVENTAYFNGTTYYWKAAGKVSGKAKPGYNWDVVKVNHAYTDADTWDKNKIYYYEAANTYYWIEPYYFHSSETNPNLATTSVVFTNKHTDFFNQSKVLPQTIVKNNNTTETIVLDGANRIISSSSVNRVFDTDFENWHWLELLDGKNEITIEGNCTVTLEWREVRKVGA